MADLSSQVSADYTKLIREQTRQVDLDAFRERGVTKVNVINAKKINELIESAVGSVIARLEGASVQRIKEDKAQVILDSVSEFKRLFREQQQQADAAKAPLAEEAERVRAAASEAVAEQIRDLKAWHINAQSKAQHEQMDRERAAAAERKQFVELMEATKAALERPAPKPVINVDSLAKALEPTVVKAAADSARISSDETKAAIQEALSGVAAMGAQVAAAISGLKDSLSGAISSQAAVSGDATSRAVGQVAEVIRQELAAMVAAQGKASAELLARLESAQRSAEAAQSASSAKVGGAIEAIAADVTAVRHDEASLKAAFTALAGAVASAREETSRVRADVSAALAKPAGVDPTQLQTVIAGAVESAQRDLLARLERQGVVKGVSSVESADEAVASAVVRSAFKDIDAGRAESSMDGVIRKQETTKGDAAQAALDRLRKLRGK